MEKTKGLTFPQLVKEAFLLFHKLFRDKLLQVRLKFLLRGGMMHALTDIWMGVCVCVASSSPYVRPLATHRKRTADPQLPGGPRDVQRGEVLDGRQALPPARHLRRGQRAGAVR